MSANQSKIYFANNKEGHLCCFDSKTHRCIDVPLYTGCDVAYVLQHEKEWLGQLDPKFENYDG